MNIPQIVKDHDDKVDEAIVRLRDAIESVAHAHGLKTTEVWCNKASGYQVHISLRPAGIPEGAK